MFVFKAMVGEECVGAIVCKLDMHKKMFRRGYIAMLAVDSKYRRKGIGKNSLFLLLLFLPLNPVVGLTVGILKNWSWRCGGYSVVLALLDHASSNVMLQS